MRQIAIVTVMVAAGCAAPVGSAEQPLTGCMEPGTYEVQLDGPAELDHPNVEVGEDGRVPVLGIGDECYSSIRHKPMEGCVLHQHRACPRADVGRPDDHGPEMPMWEGPIRATHTDRATGTIEYRINYALGYLEYPSEGTYAVTIVPAAD